MVDIKKKSSFLFSEVEAYIDYYIMFFFYFEKQFFYTLTSMLNCKKTQLYVFSVYHI